MDSAEFAPRRGQFDTVVCLNVLEHVRDPMIALRNLYSALEPGGRAVIYVPQGPGPLFVARRGARPPLPLHPRDAALRTRDHRLPSPIAELLQPRRRARLVLERQDPEAPPFRQAADQAVRHPDADPAPHRSHLAVAGARGSGGGGKARAWLSPPSRLSRRRDRSRARRPRPPPASRYGFGRSTGSGRRSAPDRRAMRGASR